MQEPHMSQKFTHDTEQDHEQKPASQLIQANTQGAIEEAQKEVESSRVPWYRSIKRGRLLLALYTIQLSLFGVLALWVHFNPVLPIDVTITREFQENQAPWLKYTMVAISLQGNVFLLSIGLVVLAGVILWLVHLHLEAVTLVVLSVVSALLNGLLKLLVERP